MLYCFVFLRMIKVMYIYIYIYTCRKYQYARIVERRRKREEKTAMRKLLV